MTGVIVLATGKFGHNRRLKDCPTVQRRADPRTYSFEALAKSSTYRDRFIKTVNVLKAQGLNDDESNHEARELLSIRFGFKDYKTALQNNLEHSELQRKAGFYRICQFHWEQYHREGDTLTTLDFSFLAVAIKEFENKLNEMVNSCIDDNFDESEPMFLHSIKKACSTKVLKKLGVIKDTN